MAYFIGELIACFLAACIFAIVVAIGIMAVTMIGATKFWLIVAIITIILILTTTTK